MLFNSLAFAMFFVVVFALYWFVFNKNLRGQNLMLQAASYFFYACWDWRFLFLLMFSTFLDYYTGLKIYDAQSKTARRTWLIISVGINLGFLCFFKYYNFFAQSMVGLFQNFGLQLELSTLNVILPVGISFYTFHGLSYVFDLYNRKIEPSRDYINYALFVSFFPLLVAGPIERATHLLPQVNKPRTFSMAQAKDGLIQMIWGFFKKMVVADTCAVFANDIFNNYTDQNGFTLFMGAIFFAFQIYGDFSGYSDIAIGISKMLGFELMTNFKFPYFSRDIAEFWRRWHISLSSWFRDYLYFPLGGSRVSRWKAIRNIFIIFLVSGFWHGANWTFLAWGGLHAALYLPLFLTDNNRKNLVHMGLNVNMQGLKEGANVLFTFAMVVLAWIFFRANNISDAVNYIAGIFSKPWNAGYFLKNNRYLLISGMAMFAIVQMLAMESWCLKRNWLFPKLGFAAAVLMIIEVVFLGSYKNHFQFIYFQF
jgi:D-alanyl-lipoteichoic acid acyltransferase DltB (MBOAT superfamily)